MSQVASIPVRVRQIAKLIRQMDAEERRWLVQLVPELQTTRITAEQSELYAYFEPRLQRLADAHPMSDADPFIGGLSVSQFFALPEDDQARLWEQVHTEAARDLNQRELSVRPNARPAR